MKAITIIIGEVAESTLVADVKTSVVVIRRKARNHFASVVTITSIRGSLRKSVVHSGSDVEFSGAILC
jgi:hypothetical protein